MIDVPRVDGVGSWTNTTLPPELHRPTTGTSRGILRPEDGSGRPRSARYEPDRAVADYIEHHWTVHWSQGGSARRAVLGHPAIHLTVEDADGPLHGHPVPAALLHGVVRKTFEVDLPASGWVFGARFRPGGFTALTGIPARDLTDLVAPAVDLLPEADELRGAVLNAPDDGARSAVFDRWIEAQIPDLIDPDYELILEVVARIIGDRSIQRAETLATDLGCSLRTLQRRFEHYVGVGPKWLISRYRLHDALAAIDDEPDAEIDLAGIAASLGWFDQAHFTRDFTAHVGVSPQAYRSRTR